MNTTPQPPRSDGGLILPYLDLVPQVHPSVFLAAGSIVAGDVTIGEDSSVWFNTVIRGDVFHVRIGRRVNVQDLSMIHVTTGKHATIVEDDVTIGHRALLHGCYVAHHVLIGMGAIVMDEARIDPFCIVAAGAVVTPGTHIPEGTLAVGAPAKPRRDLTDAERASLEDSAARYVKVARAWREQASNSPLHTALDGLRADEPLHPRSTA